MTPTRRSTEPGPSLSLARVLEVLETSPGRIKVATARLAAATLLEPMEPGGWSARDVLGHIRACDSTWGGYIERIIDEDQPRFRAESPRSTIRRTDFLEGPFAASLAAFTRDRARLVGRLRAVPTHAFSRTALVTIPALGTEPRTALYYAERLARHEREHVRQIERGVEDHR